MKIIFNLLLILCIVNQLKAQPTFEKTYGTIDDDEGYTVSICKDGSYIISGYVTNLYTGDQNIYTAKIDIYGDTVWTRTEGTSNYYEYGLDAIQTMDDGYIITGRLKVNGDDSPFLLKYDEDGNKVWLIDYSQYAPSGLGHAVLQTIDSGFTICGVGAYNEGNELRDVQKAFLLKTNKYGAYIWIKTKGYWGTNSANDMCFSEDAGFVICGVWDIPGEYYDAWMFKVTSAGSFSWNQTYGGEYDNESAYRVRKTPDGGFIFCGTFFYDILLFDGDIYVVKTDAGGLEEWSRTYGTYGDERARGIDIAVDGGYIICGTMDDTESGCDDIWLIRIDDEGDTLWTQTFGGLYDEDASEICTTADGGYIICGSTHSYGIGGSDIYLIKTNTNGVITDVPDHSQGKLKQSVTPNLTNGVIYLKNCPTDLEYEITDPNGRVIMVGKRHCAGSSEIDIIAYPSGIYILKVKLSNGIVSFKLIKE
jgi:hypothetical protein